MCVSDWGRIHREFWQHPKAERVGLEALGLWTLCNSYSKFHRTAGLISFDCPLLEGREACVEALVAERLWNQTALGYVFNDWEIWNSDETPKTTSAKLVAEVVPAGHPTDVLRRLANEAAKLLEEGVEYSIVKAALKVWLSKDNAPIIWLPMFVSDVIKQGGSGERDAALRQAWITGDLKPLVKFNLVFTPPDLPLEITTVGDAKAFMLRHKQAWIERVRKEP